VTGVQTCALPISVERRDAGAAQTPQHAAVDDGIQAPIVIRSAADADAPAIDRLGLLDGHRLPAGERVVAEAGGQILAAAEISSGTTIADPFKPTGGIARLVAMRAKQLRAA